MTDDTQVPEQAPPAKDAVVSSETDTDATVDSRTTAKGRPCRAAEEAVSDISEASDAMLLAAIAEDASRAAFVELFGRYAGRIKAFLLRSGAAHDEAEDSAQEVMVTVWRRAGQFDSTKAAVSTWIFTIARNKRIDMMRRMRRHEPDALDPVFEPDPVASAETGFAGQERDGRVRAALTSLSEDQLAVVRLAFFAGLSQSEIADRLGTPLGTVKSRMRLSFQRLRDALGDEFQFELRDG